MVDGRIRKASISSKLEPAVTVNLKTAALILQQCATLESIRPQEPHVPINPLLD